MAGFLLVLCQYTLALFGYFFVQCVVQVMISLTNERRGPKRSYKKEGILRRLQIFRVPYSIPSERIRKKDYMTFFAISNLLLPKSRKERDFFQFEEVAYSNQNS